MMEYLLMPRSKRGLNTSTMNSLYSTTEMEDLEREEQTMNALKLAKTIKTSVPVDPNGSDERLSVAAPVFNEATGEYFGMTVIELDISARIRDVLLAQGTIDGEIYIADGDGQLLVTAHPSRGVQLARRGEAIPNLPAEVKAKLSANTMPFELQLKDEYVARRMYVDPDGRGVMIFARLADES